jgi:hypothetical protein
MDDDRDGVPNVNDKDSPCYTLPGGGGYDNDGDGVPNVNDLDSPCYLLPGGGGDDDDGDGIPHVNDKDSPCYPLPGGGGADDDGDGVPNVNDLDSLCYLLPGGGGADDDGDGVSNINDPDSPCYLLPGGGASGQSVVPTMNVPNAVNEQAVGAVYEAERIQAIRTPFKTIYLTEGESLILPVAFDGENGGSVEADPGIAYRSSRTNVAKISRTGRITAQKKGKAVITVRATSGRTLKVTVNVVAKKSALRKLTAGKPGALKKKGKAWKAKIGKTAILKPAVKAKTATNLAVTFRSSNPKVLKIDRAGKIWPQSKGKATVTVKVKQTSGKSKIFKKVIYVT